MRVEPQPSAIPYPDTLHEPSVHAAHRSDVLRSSRALLAPVENGRFDVCRTCSVDCWRAHRRAMSDRTTQRPLRDRWPVTTTARLERVVVLVAVYVVVIPVSSSRSRSSRLESP